MNLIRCALLTLLFAIFHGDAAEGARITPLAVAAGGKAGFTAMKTDATGVDFTNLLARSRSLTNSIFLNGSGVAAGDVDADGWCDLYFCGLDGPNRLYRNLGHWKFQEVSDAAGAACATLDATGAAFADLDGDGDLDLVVNSVRGGTHIFLNDGKGHFTEAPGSPLNLGKGGMSLALADVDGNGTLDLYVANYRTSALMDMGDVRFNFRTVDGQRAISTVNGRPASDPEFLNRFYINEFGRIEEAGEADAFFLNDGHAGFTPVSWTGGAFLDESGEALKTPPFDWGLSALFHDLNGDGRPDLYVCNDFDSPDRIWINQGGGKFRELPRPAMRSMSLFAMGVDIADVNRDGFDDIFVLDMLSRDHRLRMTSLPGNARERAGLRPQYVKNSLQLNRGDGTYSEIAEFAGVSAAEWAWSAIFLDVDLDGFEDLLITNGNEADGRDADAAEKIRQIRVSRQLTFQERMDLRRMFRKLDTANVAFRNRGNLTFEDAGAAWGFDLAGVSNGMCLADLDNDGDMDVVINNLNGAATLLRNETSAPRVAVRLIGNNGNTHGIGARVAITGGPVRQSQEIIAGGRYLSSDQAQRTFAAGKTVEIEVRWPGGRTSKIANVPADSLCEVFETNSIPAENVVEKKIAPLFQDVSDLLQHTNVAAPSDDFARQPLLPRRVSAIGPDVLWKDLNGDGRLDLVIDSTIAFENLGTNGFKAITLPAKIENELLAGGRSIPGKYPLAKSPEFGLVNGVASADFNGDGVADTALACEWGSLRVLIYDGGKRVDKTKSLGLDRFTGWWNCVATGDFDKDGRRDIVAGNWGLNSRYKATVDQPERLYYLDFDGDGIFEIIEAHYDPAQKKIVPWRLMDTLSKGLPGLKERFPTHAAYASASIQEILGDRFADAKQLEANTLESMIFLNRGDHFEPLPLPAEAQWAPAMGVCVADFDGDGNDDIFLAQNFFGSETEVPRGDAGNGLFLLGDGQGHFRALSTAESGLQIPGEQRGCAAADFDGDGKIDLAVGVHGGATKLYRNIRALSK